LIKNIEKKIGKKERKLDQINCIMMENIYDENGYKWWKSMVTDIDENCMKMVHVMLKTLPHLNMKISLCFAHFCV
jgi:hypothetical protein